MSERRKSVRQKSFLRGRIYFNNRQSSLDCLIRDVSDDGAKLIFSDTASIPDVVEIYIPHKDQTVQARVRWRSDDEAGVVFKSAERAHAGDMAELAERVAQLETEVASLKRMLKRMKAATAAGNEPEAA